MTAEEVIIKYIDLIDMNQFEEVYNTIGNDYRVCPPQEKGRLGAYFIQLDLNPLDYMTTVPEMYLMYQNQVKEIYIPSNITKIDHHAFHNCDLSEIIIPDSIIDIDTQVFYDNSNLEKVVMSKNIKKIGFNIFEKCPKLKEITFNGTIKELKRTPFLKRVKWRERSNIKRFICHDGVIELEN